MLNSVWRKIKSGSDIRGIAFGNDESVELTNDVVKSITVAFAVWISKRKKLSLEDITISVGHDSRVSSLRIKNLVINTLRFLGVTVYDCSLASTPAMAMSIHILKTTASIQITASHHPKERNGFKFFTSEGGVSSSDISEILEIAKENPKFTSKQLSKIRIMDIMDYYSEKLKNIIKNGIVSTDNTQKPLEGLKIVIDAGNGVGGFFASKVLEPLGADVSGSIGLEPDGNFPIHIPNPEDSTVIEHASKLTLECKADLGIVFDTDVDRVAIIDSLGNMISKTKLIALTSSIVLEEFPNSIIVTDSVTNESLKTFIDKIGGSQLRYKRGYHNVISMAKKINSKGGECHLAIETSGHAAFKENNFIDDGAYLACKIIVKMINEKLRKRKLSDVIENFNAPVEEIDLRFPINSDSKSESSEKVIKDLLTLAKSNKSIELDEENHEGVRLHFSAKHQNGWILLRESVHDPVLILHIESYTLGGMKSISDFMKQFLKKYSFLGNVSK